LVTLPDRKQSSPEDATDSPLESQAAWNAHLTRLGGHLLQSWQWGEFKRKHGWSVERVAVGDDETKAMAQILFRERGPVSVAYIPRGPALSDSNGPSANHLMERIKAVCKRRRALYIIVEPDGFGEREPLARLGFVEAAAHIQPARTVKIPLLSDDELLAQMHQKTRYSVRLAPRRGVTIKRSPWDDVEALDVFFGLLRDTSVRNDFGIHDKDYYVDFMEQFRDDAVLLLSYIDEAPAAGLISARFGDEAIYMYGGSSSANRAHGAAFYLQFEAMRWAREAGSLRYDLWGIPEKDPESMGDSASAVAATKGDDWRGLYRFKTGFGGEIVNYPPPLERDLVPGLASVARRFARARE
jgi:lipid II:glycine glycyltransferase (peptidoglycan interpeptide bridge formation enzyme)